MSDPVVVDHGSEKTPLHVPPFSRDIRLILNKYVELNTTSLREFKILWKSLKFSYIHEGRPDEVNYETYIQEVFTTCIGYLIFNHETKLSKKEMEDLSLSDDLNELEYPLNFRVRIGVIYLLYFLYCTQPKTIQSTSHKKPAQIKISIDAFKELVNMMEKCTERDLTEPYIVLSRLKALSAFEYCAMTYVDPLMSSLRDPNDNLEEELVSDEVAKIATTSHTPRINTEELNNVAVDYQTVKNDIIKGIERSNDNITHQHTVAGHVSVAKSLGLCKPEIVGEIQAASNSLEITDDQKVNQFLDKWENDPAGASLIKKKRRKKRVKKKEEDNPKAKQTSKKPPSKVSLEVSKAVNDYIATSIFYPEEESTKKKKKSAPKKRKKSEETEEPKKKKKKKEDSESKKSKKKDETEEPKKKEKKSKKKKKGTDSEDEKPKKSKKKKESKKKVEKKKKSSKEEIAENEPKETE